MEKIKISSIEASEILASNGKPTLKVKVFLENNLTGEFKVPLGTSTGKKEAKELRDQDEKYFFGLGVKKAIRNIEEIIKPKLIGENVFFQEKIDEILIELDGTQDKSKLGANALIGVSGACLKAAAQAKNLPLWQYLSQKYGFTPKIPGFLMNFVNGGKHSFSPLKFQEYLFIIQKEIPSLERLNLAYFVFSKLKEKIKELKVKALGVGDEGGLVVPFEDEKLPLKILKEIIETLPEYFSQISPLLGLDLAASSFFEKGRYQTSIGKLTSDEM
ncbi:phosphopyruvate hydratase, partial [bacterium]|nr:phosphopyruvate hydratase [bacterium]